MFTSVTKLVAGILRWLSTSSQNVTAVSYTHLLSGIDPKDIRADDPDVMKLFSGTDILGVTPEQIGTPTGM